mmetsp:Transcript_41754/g.50853  ORF Transcript_41754/g.50853 Transcript_41754/m.50853 type:complete len:174 (+) Transcript_41754:90-611(+)|eukprot:CAMPEP_0172497086 /NCGR_PEP_ID=MMETSP1066-20121228/95015_1 /TAXON_ID=671091 /ORGANISM="Coscinodiscus wailesii, Strain CCMP2513" /LENGTH=173 /DNA_ID=CAMNT_0013269671 /DNA_START=58 /DNA_END=579 /DNA_ORIENTATION=+
MRRTYLLSIASVVFVSNYDVSTAYQNVLGTPLKKCSQPGMAMTGFTRDGSCTEYQDDVGSHHICIDLSSESLEGHNFCDVTGQSNWCDSSMPCMPSHGRQMNNDICPVRNWCVCQWAFASYIKNAGGCDKIQTIDCEATNMEALNSYRDNAQDDSIQNALECIVDRCNIGDEY